jgi:hypothetical protein
MEKRTRTRFAQAPGYFFVICRMMVLPFLSRCSILERKKSNGKEVIQENVNARQLISFTAVSLLIFIKSILPGATYFTTFANFLINSHSIG